MTGKTIEFIFDFGSPNAYLVWQVLPALAERTGATITLTPCLLGGLFKITGNQPPFVAFGGIQGKMAYERLEMDRFIRRHRLDRFRFNPHFPVNTLALMRGMIAAQDMGLERPYLEAGLRAMWEDGRKMDDPAELLAVLDAAGLDSTGLNASGAGLWASGRDSGIGGVAPRQRSFWLVADAELIVYGATDPSARLSIGGEEVPLSADGTFRVQVPFRDGKQLYPIEAIAADGEQKRNITLEFSRITPEDNSNPADKAVNEWF